MGSSARRPFAELVDPTLLHRGGEYAGVARATPSFEACDRDVALFVAGCAQRCLTAWPAEQARGCICPVKHAHLRPMRTANPWEVPVEGEVLKRDGLLPARIARPLAAVPMVHRAAGVTNRAIGLRRAAGTPPASLSTR